MKFGSWREMHVETLIKKSTIPTYTSMHTVPLWLIFIFVCAPCAHAYKGVCVFLFDYPTTKHHHTQTHTFHTSHKHTNTHPHRKSEKIWIHSFLWVLQLSPCWHTPDSTHIEETSTAIRSLSTRRKKSRSWNVRTYIGRSPHLYFYIHFVRDDNCLSNEKNK